VETIGFIGGGNMAEALIKGILAAKLYTPEDILVSDIRAERKEYLGKEYRVQPVEHNKELSSQVDILVLSVKPQQMNEALNSIAGSLKQGQLVISIAAGIKTAAIAEKLGDLPIVYRSSYAEYAGIDWRGGQRIVCQPKSPACAGKG
jgi:pyrroline-5-carboxylate reductase